MPPIDGLQDIWPSVSMLCVSSSVRRPIRALASAASVPAWPPPITMTSKRVGKIMILQHFLRVPARRGAEGEFYANAGLGESRRSAEPAAARGST